jgi:hypothetical protein
LKNKEKARECIGILDNEFEFRNSENKRMFLGEGGADVLAEEWMGMIQDKYPDFGPRSVTKEQYDVTNRDKAKEKIKKVFSELDGVVIGALTYIDPTTVNYLKFIPTHCDIKLFTHGGKDWDKFKGRKDKKLRHKVVEVKEIRNLDGGRYLHACWIADGNIKIDFDNDLKDDALNRRQTIKIRTHPRIDKHYRDFKKNWSKSEEELKQEGIKVERVV